MHIRKENIIMLHAVPAHFIVINIVIVCLLFMSLYNGWHRGAVRSLTDFMSSIGKILIAGFGGYFLMKIFNPIPADKVNDFLLHRMNALQEARYPGRPEVTELGQPQLVEVVCKLTCVLIYFIIFMIILSAIEKALVKRHRERTKDKEKKDSLPDHIAGAFLGFLLFLVCAILPCPAFITAQAINFIGNGNDIVYKSFFAFPVNLVARPLTRLAAGEETDREFWEEKGILIFDQEAQDLGKWWEENGIQE